VDKGQAVNAGDLLAEIEVPERLAELKRFQADAKLAEIDLQRLSEAQKKAPDLVTPQALDKARGALDVANASIEGTRTLLDFAKITAPFGGIITMRFVDPGAFVPAATAGSTPKGAALFTLMDFSTVRVQTGVPEMEVPHVREGQPVRVTIEELPGRVMEGKVSRFSYALDEATRTMLVETDLPNPDQALRPGMYASVRIGLEKHTDALLVPVEALVMEKTAAFLFKLANGKAAKTPVTLAFNDGANVEIAKGLNENESVIVVGKMILTDGQPVQAAETQ
jgi:RND family efflux transporter MFP subunit